MKRLLIIGASGLVGKALAAQCNNEFDIYGTFYTSPTNLSEDKQFQLNIQDREQLKAILNHVGPDLVISCLHGDFAQLLVFHKLLATELKNSNSSVYFLSTTNVFDGDLSRHHSEADEPNSKSEYGQYKIQCENMLQQMLGERSIIIRIPGIWGIDSPRFNTLLNHIDTNEPIKAYRNLECSFLSDVQLAQQLQFVLKNELRGIIHLTSEDKVLESQFYEMIIKKLTSNEVAIQYTDYQASEKLYYFGLNTIRNDLPPALEMRNKDLITYLTNKGALQ